MNEYMHNEMERKLSEDVGKIFLGFLRIHWRVCERILSVGEYKMLNKSHVNYNIPEYSRADREDGVD